MALIETNGAGDLLGVWVAGPGSHPPSAAFLTPEAQLTAMRFLADARVAVESDGRTWHEVLAYLRERQNLITVQRFTTKTDLTPSELLAQARDLWPLWRT